MSDTMCDNLITFHHGGHGGKMIFVSKTPCSSVYSVVFYSYVNAHGSKHIQTLFGKSLWRTGVIFYIFELIKNFDKFVFVDLDNIAHRKFIRIIFYSLIYFSGFNTVNPCRISSTIYACCFTEIGKFLIFFDN